MQISEKPYKTLPYKSFATIAAKSKRFKIGVVYAGLPRGALCALAHSIFKKLCAKSALSTFLVRYVRYWVKKRYAIVANLTFFLVRYVRSFQLLLLIDITSGNTL